MWQGPRGEFEGHNNVCPQLVIACPNAKFGCEKSFAREKFSQHLKDDCVISNVSPKLKEYVEKSSATIEELKTQLEQKKATSFVATDLNKQMMEAVWLSIQNAIGGYNTVKGGATVYDQGAPEQCFRLYYLTCSGLLQTARAIFGAEFYRKMFWVVIIEKVLEDALPTVGSWATTDDAAWRLRRAFEAIKYGLSLRDKKYTTAAYSASRFLSQEYIDIASSNNYLPPKAV